MIRKAGSKWGSQGRIYGRSRRRDKYNGICIGKE